jgi:D-alanine-D-alanine ligase
MAPQACCVGVVFGGNSGEHAISILSARTVISALQRGRNAERYRLLAFYIDRAGNWWPPEVAAMVLADGAQAGSQPVPPSVPPPGFRELPSGALDVEVWFPVLHGPNGEDGTIQGLFTLMQVPFVGAGVLGSALGMDKLAMKAAFAAAGLPQVPYAAVMAAELDTDPEQLLTRLEGQLGYPCFVKPANLGSSVGISKATDRHSLLAGLRQAAAFDPRLVVERGVRARELECAVRTLGSAPGGPLQASVVGEIRFDADWYDYETKYTEGLSSTVIPALLPEAVSEELRRLAIRATQAVAATGLARVDFFYEESSGTIWLNEINTLPGFTSQSMYPMLWQASGVSLEDLVHQLVVAAGENEPMMVGETLAP